MSGARKASVTSTDTLHRFATPVEHQRVFRIALAAFFVDLIVRTSTREKSLARL
jgi:hypothetical protein